MCDLFRYVNTPKNKNQPNQPENEDLEIKRMDSMHDIRSPFEKQELFSPASPVKDTTPLVLKPKLTIVSQKNQSSSNLMKNELNSALITSGRKTGPETPLRKVLKRNTISTFKVAWFSLQKSIPPSAKLPSRPSKIIGETRSRINSEVAQTLNSVLRKKKTKSTDLCTICIETPSNTIFEPCLHGGVCAACAIESYKSHNRLCSFCREVVFCDCSRSNTSSGPNRPKKT